MLGLALAALYVGWKYVTDGNAPLEPSFLAAASFLCRWYSVWTCVLGAIVGLIALLATAGVTTAGAKSAGAVGGFGGLLLGGGVSVLIGAVFAIRSALLLVGSYLLAHAGLPSQTFAEFNTRNLVIGSALIGIALVVFRTSGSSSKSKD